MPLEGLLRGRLKFADMLAKKKAISLTISDETGVCSEYPGQLTTSSHHRSPPINSSSHSESFSGEKLINIE